MQLTQEVGGVGKFSVGKNDRMTLPGILLYTCTPYFVGIITYNGLTGIFAVKTVVVDRSWPRCVFP